jgi:hypothetical protein
MADCAAQQCLAVVEKTKSMLLLIDINRIAPACQALEIPAKSVSDTVVIAAPIIGAPRALNVCSCRFGMATLRHRESPVRVEAVPA